MKFVAIDTETELFEPPTKVRAKVSVPRLVCMTWCTDEGETGLLQSYDDAKQQLTKWKAKGYRLVFHNAPFDVGVLAKALRLDVDWFLDFQVYDTLMMLCLRDVSPNRRLTLQGAARKFCGIHLKKGDVRTSFRVGQVLTEEQREYAIQDAVATAALFLRLRELAPGEATDPSPHRHLARKCEVVPPHQHDLVSLLDEAYSSVNVLRAVGLDASGGLCVNYAKVEEYAAEAVEAIEEARTALHEAGLGRFKRKPKAEVGAAPEGVAATSRSWTYNADAGGMVRLWKGEAQRVDAVFSLDEHALRAAYAALAEELELADVPVSEATGQLSLTYPYWRQHKAAMPASLRAHVVYQKASKLLSTYYAPLLEKRPESVAPSFQVGFAETGRWTCNRPNVQNVPKKQRDMFRAGDGKLFVSADYSALEVWTLAEALCCFGIAGPLVDVLREGVDLHTRTAALLFDVPESEVTKEQRQGAKACNFGIPGGMGPRKFALTAQRQYRLPWSVEMAAAIRQRWLSVYSDVARFLNLFKVPAWQLVYPGVNSWLLKETLGFDPTEYVSSFDLSKKLHGGRLYDVVLPSGRRFPNRTYSQAANVYLQGTGAEVTTLAVSLLMAGPRYYTDEIAAVVHDSITLAVSEVEVPQAQRDLRDAMLEAQKLVLQTMAPHLPDVEVTVSKEWR